MVPQLVPEIIVIAVVLVAVLFGIDNIAHNPYDGVCRARALLSVFHGNALFNQFLDISSVFSDYKVVTFGVIFNHILKYAFSNEVAKIKFFLLWMDI
jgi:hypothetical protein